VERAILAGDRETGVCLMELEEGLDTGPVYARAATPVGPDETAEELRHRLGDIGTELLLKNLSIGLGTPEPQIGEPTYAAKISVDDLRLDFGQAAEICNRVVRVGRAWTTWRGKRLLVHRARVLGEERELFAGQIQGDRVGTAAGALEFLIVQPEGKPPMDGGAWARGARPQPSERLGEWDRPT
jgi:methionyl-tRNA formyltransferase